METEPQKGSSNKEPPVTGRHNRDHQKTGRVERGEASDPKLRRAMRQTQREAPEKEGRDRPGRVLEGLPCAVSIFSWAPAQPWEKGYCAIL